MENQSLHEEAEECRRKAVSYLGKPEAPLLLRIAREFDRIAADGAFSGLRKGDATGANRRLG